MKEDVLDRLKAKEEEMEALINGARRKAVAIREEALKKAKDLKSDKIKEIEKKLDLVRAEKEREMEKEAARIEEEGRTAAAELKSKGEAGKDSAVKEAVRFIMEGTVDKGDDKGPDNRA